MAAHRFHAAPAQRLPSGYLAGVLATVTSVIAVPYTGELWCCARAIKALEGASGGTLRRSDPSGAGIRRRRCGRGFRYLGADAAVITGPRMYATRFHEGFGTLYTAEYRPADDRARYHWPDMTWEHSLDQLGHDSFRIDLGTA